MKPRLLDLFCGAGGAAMGYHRAGFEVVGVDIKPQPNYPFELHQQDALIFLEDVAGWGPFKFDAIHASPPCQHWTAYRRTGNVGEYPDLIEPTRKLLLATGLPYVIENLENAPLHRSMMLCGSMFEETMDIRRHRVFEFNWTVTDPHEPVFLWPCRHKLQAAKRFPGGRSKERTGRSDGLVRSTMEIGSWDIPLRKQQKAMGIDWMTLEELSEAIPPTYTEFIGQQLMAHLEQKAVA